MQINTTTDTNKKTIPHDIPTAILPPFDRPPFFQNKGQSGKEGTPHNPLLPERLQIDDQTCYINTNSKLNLN